MSEATKVCGICGMSCANKPRIKDPSGQYYCKTCHDEAMAQRKMLDDRATAPTRVASADDLIGFANDDLHAAEARDAAEASGRSTGGPDAIDALSDLLPPPNAPSPGSGDTCPGCGQGIAPGSVVCINCGHNFQSGGQAMTTVAKPKKAKTGGGVGGSITMSPMLAFLLVAFVPIVLAAVGAFGGIPALAGLALVAVGLIGFGVWLWAIVAAFQYSAVDGIISLLFAPYQLFFVFFRNDNSYLKATYAGNFIASVGCVAIVVAGGVLEALSDMGGMSG